MELIVQTEFVFLEGGSGGVKLQLPLTVPRIFAVRINLCTNVTANVGNNIFSLNY